VRGKYTAYFANWIVPISSAPIRDGVVVVEGAKIAYVGSDLTAFARDAGLTTEDVARDIEIDRTHGIIMPGLVNAHTHLELTVMRGMLEGLHFREWLRVLTEARAKVLDADALVDSSLFGIREGLLAGITTYADTTASGAPLTAMRTMGVRGIGYLEVFGPAEGVAGDALTALESRTNAARLLDTSLVKTGVSPHAPYTVSHELFKRVGQFARENMLPVAVHVAESEAETEMIRYGLGTFADGLRSRGIRVKATNASPIQYLETSGILRETRALLIHCIRIDEQDARTIVDTGCTIVHCPISNAKLGHGIAPLELMLQAGIKTGLGTDSVASNNRMDILGEARVATLLQSIRRAMPDALSATDALRLATLGGAEALGMEHAIGTLEVGKQADITMFGAACLAGVAAFNVADFIVHTLAGTTSVKTVLVGGEVRVENGSITSGDEGIAGRARLLSEALAGWRQANLGS
jgi:cytosine/adenosine deaminase-related metal-dependent hydrolase